MAGHQTILCLFLFLCTPFCLLRAQITTGTVEGSVYDVSGPHRAKVKVSIKRIPAGLDFTTATDAQGRFTLVLPYGDYRLSISGEVTGASPTERLHVSALQTVQCHLVLLHGAVVANLAGRKAVRAEIANSWSLDFRQPDSYFGSYSIAGSLLNQARAIVTQPLDFTGLASSRLALISQRGFSWTGTQQTLQGLDAADPYQPGSPIRLEDAQTTNEVTTRSDLFSGTSRAYGMEVGTFLSQQVSEAASSGLRLLPDNWHGQLSSADTGSAFASGNLPNLATRNSLQQSEHYNWFTRDNLQAGGAIGERADLFFSGTGQWASQTSPIAPLGQDQNSRLLFGNASGRIKLTGKDQVEALYSGSRINLSDWGQPAGLSELLDRRMAPAYNSIYGFSGLGEDDNSNFLQVGWTRELAGASGAGALQVHYGFSTVHLNTGATTADQQSTTDLLTGAITGAPPLTNRGVRTRHEIEAAFLPGDLEWHSRRHRIAMGGGWEHSTVENQFATPSGLNLITAAGVPDSVIEFNDPATSRDLIQEFSAYVRDEIQLASWVSIDIGALGDFARGSVPGQASPGGDLIAWNSVSPHAVFAVTAPELRWLVVRGGYSRRYAPLAGQLLDFGNANGLSGLEYQWNDSNGDRQFQPAEQGVLLRRFGGEYSSISPSLRRPYADQFDINAEARLPFRSVASIQLYRRDEKNRLAAVNIGVPPQSFNAVTIHDPGSDGIPGTFDDQQFLVYEQNPATFGQDRFSLTNPAGLREQYDGFTAQVTTRHRHIDFHASFTAEKSWGPTNPGDGVLENDPGIVGALYMDPNTLIHDSGRDFFDRGFVGKMELLSHLPARLGGLELNNIVDYLDGLVFARQLLVGGLAQGPLAVATTVRGSPEGGNRAEYVLNWNLRLSRAFRVPFGNLRVAADVLNVMNAANRVQESDVSSAAFNQRLALAIQPPRFVRLHVSFDF